MSRQAGSERWPGAPSGAGRQGRLASGRYREGHWGRSQKCRPDRPEVSPPPIPTRCRR